MYVYQNGKLYAQCGDNKLVGVEIHSDKIVKVKGTITTLANEHEILTPHEVQCRFQIAEGGSYIYPKKEVVNNVTATTPEGTTK